MIKIDKKESCCGCTACAAICPKNCIEMKKDREGFRYPCVDEDKCVECGACEKVCPVQKQEEKTCEQRAFLVQYKNDKVRLESSAGGAFTAIAETVLEKGGVVFGAAYDEKFQVQHVYVENKEDLKIFRNSKYVQSDLKNTFCEVKEFLKNNKYVCFSGTPCQLEGLNSFLGKKYDRLIMVDVVCHGIPSPFIWNKYLEYQKNEIPKVDNIRFRDKYFGYKYSTMSFVKDGKNLYHAGSQADPMLRAFFTDICDRPSCYNCPAKKRYRVSDMTIWDCFSVYDFDKKMDDDKGTTRVLCHTDKGLNVVEQIKDRVNCKEVSADKLVAGVKEMFESVKMNPRRDDFFDDAQAMTGKELFEKYYPITAKIKIKTIIRKTLLVTGIYGTMKKILNKARGR